MTSSFDLISLLVASIMPLSFINQGCFDFSLPLVSELRCRDPFSVKVKFPSGGETDDVIMFQFIKL